MSKNVRVITGTRCYFTFSFISLQSTSGILLLGGRNNPNLVNG